MLFYVHPLPLPTTQATARLPYVASVADFWCTQLASDKEVEDVVGVPAVRSTKDRQL